MKKILLAVLFLLVGFSGNAQFSNCKYDQFVVRSGIGYECQSFTVNTGIQYLDMLSDVTTIRMDGDIAFGRVWDDLRLMASIGAGVELGNFYQPHWFFMIHQRFIFPGDGPQSAGGDHMRVSVSFSTGGVYRYELPHGYIYGEAGVMMNVDVIHIQGYEHDDVGFYAAVGYSFIIR